MATQKSDKKAGYPRYRAAFLGLLFAFLVSNIGAIHPSRNNCSVCNIADVDMALIWMGKKKPTARI